MKKAIYLLFILPLLIISNAIISIGAHAQAPIRADSEYGLSSRSPAQSTLQVDESPVPTEPIEPAEPTALEELVAGNNQFAFDLYHAIRESDGNLFYSPYSISTAFSMLFAGAREDTEEQMANTLHYSLAQDQLHPTYKSLGADLTHEISNSEETPFTLQIANSIWLQTGYPFQEDFIDVVTENYDAMVQEVHYGSASGRKQAAGLINEWVSENTNNKIKKAIKPESLSDLTRLVLANTTYFKAEWLEHFEEGKNASFTLLDNSTVSASVMSGRRYLDYANGPGYQAVAIPYKGDRTQMIVILPDQGEFATIEEQLTPVLLSQILASLNQQDMFIQLPRFGYSAELNLDQILQTMGMCDAFVDGAADFSGISPDSLYLSDAFHKSLIEVDKQGTEAVGVTIVLVGITSIPNTPMYIALDRPFIFLIHDKATDSILFMGRVLNPLEEVAASPDISGACVPHNSRLGSIQPGSNGHRLYLPLVNQQDITSAIH